VNQAGASIWVALIAAMAASSLISVALNYVVYSPFQRRGSAPITLVIISLGMALIVEFTVAAIVGGISVSYTMNQGRTVNLGGLVLTTVQLIIIGISVVVMAGVHALLRYTKLGKAMRATAANRMLARSSGIRAGRVISITWALTGALCGLAGTVFAIDVGSFNPTSTDIFLILILAAVFLGGPGNAYGAMLGALVIGVATEVSAAYIQADYKYVVAFVILLAMLAVRPTGLLGART
jgi:branched-subunit amino acid ABC-type transport system permease component